MGLTMVLLQIATLAVGVAALLLSAVLLLNGQAAHAAEQSAAREPAPAVQVLPE